MLSASNLPYSFKLKEVIQMSATNVANQIQSVKVKREKFDIEKLRGQVFGYLTIIDVAEPHIKSSGEKRVTVTAICKCLVIKSYHVTRLKSGMTKSCGCYMAEQASKRNKTHGESIGLKTTEYRIWKAIKVRTTNPNVKEFKYYGARGIRMSDGWVNNFPQFLNDMGRRPSPKHSIERNDVNGDYCKDNCRWATKHEQAANTRRNNRNIGVCFDNTRNKWKAQLAVNGIKVLNKRFDTEREAVKARKSAEIEYNIYQ